MPEPSPPGDRGLQEALRAAVERTLAATAGSAGQTRGRAQELLDEVARRGQEARETVSRRGQEARDASASVTARVVEAIGVMRLAGADEVREVANRIEALERRVAAIEQRHPADAKPEVEAD